MLFERHCQRYIVNVTTKKVHWGLGREIIDFEETRDSLGSQEIGSHYMSEVIINVTKRTPKGFRRRFVKHPIRGI